MVVVASATVDVGACVVEELDGEVVDEAVVVVAAEVLVVTTVDAGADTVAEPSPPKRKPAMDAATMTPPSTKRATGSQRGNGAPSNALG